MMQSGKEAEKEHKEAVKGAKKKGKKRSAEKDDAAEEDSRCGSSGSGAASLPNAAELPLRRAAVPTIFPTPSSRLTPSCFCVALAPAPSPAPATRKNADEFLAGVLGSAEETPSSSAKKSKKKKKKSVS